VTSSQARPGRHRLRVGACLSLSGKYARFGTQAARGLDAWRVLDGAADVIVEDDKSATGTLEAALRRVAPECDVLLGPYSTQLMRVAGWVAAEAGWLLWNHGGSGDDVETAHPGHIVSVLTPTSRYAVPFLRELASLDDDGCLWMVHGKGSFGKQVVTGAEASARQLGIETMRADPAAGLSSASRSAPWDLFCAGSFDEDVKMVSHARGLANPPRLICAVAAGIREFGDVAGDAEGVFGVGQWFPGVARTPELGPGEGDFLRAYLARSGGVIPDYPAVQAAAGAVLAAHCARAAGATAREPLWRAALALDTRTLFGDFKIGPDGLQLQHETALMRWSADGLALA
jgi:ABC-type branched-subunit amino acid transport system substrate-binding protein